MFGVYELLQQIISIADHLHCGMILFMKNAHLSLSGVFGSVCLRLLEEDCAHVR